MGAFWSKKVGSDTYYASYERQFEVLKRDIDKIKISLHRRRNREERVGNAIFFYGAVGFGLAVLGAAWVIQQPAGTYTPQQHSLRVAPLFAEPILAFLLYYVILGAMHLWDKRDKRRVDVLSKKLRKMVSELKDSTRYEKTAKLLERFDPDYVPPTPRKQQQQHALQTAFIPPTPRGPGVPTPQGRGGKRMGLGPLQQMTDAGLGLMPAFDKLATSLIGDNPALTEALRAARGEAEGWKARTLQAASQIAELKLQVKDYRMQLGLPITDAEGSGAAPAALTWHQPDSRPETGGDAGTAAGALAGEPLQDHALVEPIIEEADDRAKPGEAEDGRQEVQSGQAAGKDAHEEID